MPTGGDSRWWRRVDGFPPSIAPMVEDWQRFRRWEWAVVVTVTLAIVILNKAIIRDEGSDWSTLAFRAGWLGVIVVLVMRWRRCRRHVRPPEPH